MSDATDASVSTAPYAWMETLLRLFYARIERSQGLALLGDHDARVRLLTTWQTELVAAGMPADMAQREEGRQLSVAVLALRLKFEQPDGIERVRRNIAMRAGG